MIHYRKYFDTIFKYFPIFLAYTFFNELLGYLIYNFEDFQLIYQPAYSQSTGLIYNIYYFFFFSYFLKVYYDLLIHLKFRRLIGYLFLVFIILNVVNSYYSNPLKESLVFAFVFGCVSISVLAFIHLKEIYTTQNITLRKHNLAYWISLGIIIFHLPYSALKLFRVYYVNLYSPHLHYLLIVFMYLLFSIGFFKCSRKAFR